MITLQESILKSQEISESILNKTKTKQTSAMDYVYYESLGVFDEFQLRAIKLAFKKGLTPEQVAVFADTKFNFLQMYEIVKGFEKCLTPEQIAVFADPKFNSDQMSQIIEGFEKGLTIERVKKYAKKSYNVYKMEQMMNSEIVDQSRTLEKIIMRQSKIPQKPSMIRSLFQKPSKNFKWYKKSGMFNDDQLDIIEKGFKKGLTSNQIDIYALPIYHRFQMEEIRKAVCDGITDEQIILMLNPKLSHNTMGAIRIGFKKGLTIDQVAVYAKPEFDADQVWEIENAFEKGLSIDQVKTFAKKSYRFTKMRKMKEELLEQK